MTRYLPMTSDEAVELATGDLPEDRADLFRSAARGIGAVVHADYRERWVLARSAAQTGGDRLIAQMEELLDSANYDEVPRAALQDALGDSAVFQVQVDADLDDFAVLRFWRRGVHLEQTTIPRWRGVRRRTVRFEEFDRVAMYARYHDEEHFTAAGREIDKLGFTPGTEYVKLFQNVPRPDLEMLLPGTRVSMRLIDKLFIGVPAVAGGIVIAVTKLASAAAFLVLLAAALVGLHETRPAITTGVLVTLFGAIVALGSYLWRQWTKYKNRKTSYLKNLSEGLYVRTLADGPGVLFTVLDAAENEDFKEALLAYRGLLDGDATAGDLDARVEARLHGRGATRVDFEVMDAVSTLQALGLAHPVDDGDGVWRAVPLERAPDVLRDRWREAGDRLIGRSLAPAPARGGDG